MPKKTRKRAAKRAWQTRKRGIEAQRDNAQQKFDEWLKKLKTASAKVDEWGKKIRYYEKQIEKQRESESKRPRKRRIDLD